MLTPEFHTLGAPQPQGPRAPEPPTAGRGPPRSYKAVVNLYLGGGADSFNMLVPISCALHDEYRAVRGPAALSNAQLLEMPSSKACGFAAHHRMPKIRELYQAGEAAFVSNIGALVEPLTRHEYDTGAKPTCVGLFSHSVPPRCVSVPSRPRTRLRLRRLSSARWLGRLPKVSQAAWRMCWLREVSSSRPAMDGYKLAYPASHTMDRFDAHRSKLHYIGKGGLAMRPLADV